MKGYKGFNADMTCRGVQYEVGKTYEMEGEPKLCERGYHFCETLVQCFDFYGPTDGAVYCEVQAEGKTATDGSKYATNRISIGTAIAPTEVWRAFYGYGNGYGDGYGYGYGYGDGNGYGNGDGYGYGYGNGNGYGNGYGYGYGNGYGDGYGYGYGNGNGYGYGDGYGDGNGYGDGYGYGNGDGYGNRNIQKILTFKED